MVRKILLLVGRVERVMKECQTDLSVHVYGYVGNDPYIQALLAYMIVV